jgi:hypothetical protein
MSDLPSEPEVAWRQLQALLLGHLSAAGVPVWPGADGLTVEDVLLTYPQAIAVARVPGREQLLAERPDLEKQLAIFFAPKDRSGGRRCSVGESMPRGDYRIKRLGGSLRVGQAKGRCGA